jgi:hypothetical protein
VFAGQLHLQRALTHAHPRSRALKTNLCDFGVENLAAWHLRVAMEVAQRVCVQDESEKRLRKRLSDMVLELLGILHKNSGMRAKHSPPLVPDKAANFFCRSLKQLRHFAMLHLWHRSPLHQHVKNKTRGR